MRGSRLGTCFLQLVHFVPVPSPPKAIHKGASDNPLTEVFVLSDQCVERLFSQDGLKDDIQETLLRVLGELPEAYPCKSALQVPIGLSQLFFVNTWSRVAISPASKWDSDSDIRDLLCRIRSYAKTLDGCNDAVAFLADSDGAAVGNAHNLYAALARDLQSWCDCICEAADDPEETRNTIHNYVLHLNTVHESHSMESFASHTWQGASTGSYYNKQLQSFGQYRAAFLLECVMFSLNLRRAGLLKKALISAANCLPAFWASTLSELLSSGCLPSESTVSRARLYLDVSFMQHWREEWKRHMGQLGTKVDDPAALFMLADSSPQGHQNWFMVEVFGVRAGMLSEAAKLFEDLYALQLKDSISSEELEKSRSWVEELRACKFHHVLPPSALGPRHATLSHKTHALLHAMRLEADGWGQVQRILSSVASITSDQGVEMGLNLVRARLDSLFPYWMQGCADLQVDSGVGHGCTQDEVGAQQLLLRQQNRDAEPEPDPDPDFISLRKSLFVPGMFHITDGITKDMLKECKLWPDMKVHFEHILSFFHMYQRRSMFLQACLSQLPELRGFKGLFSTGPP